MGVGVGGNTNLVWDMMGENYAKKSPVPRTNLIQEIWYKRKMSDSIQVRESKIFE